MTDKKGFSAYLNDKFTKNYNICEKCYRYLMVGEQFIQDNLNTYVGGLSSYLIPSLIFESRNFDRDRLGGLSSYIKHLNNSVTNLESIEEFENKIKEFIEFEEEKNNFVINYLFYQKSKSEFKVLRLIKDVPPSRLDVIRNAEFDILRLVKERFKDERQFKIDLRSIYFSIPLSKNDVMYSKYLGLLDSIFSNRNIDYSFLIDQFTELIRIIHFKREGFNISTKTNLEYKILQLNFLSTLIDADKMHAGKFEHIERRDVPKNVVDNYKNRDEFKQKNISKINKIRDEMYEAVIKKIDHVDLNQRVFSITAPTGTGKTLTSLSAALKLRRRIEEHFGYKPHIIYSLPFTSIIDQNFGVFDDVLKSTIPDFEENESAYSIKHHYQADLKYRVKGKEKPIEESLALIETWDSEIVVTTFIQLFYSIIGYKNRLLKKFHNIVNSIIILDEVQNIPIKYWDLVGSILAAMAKYFRCEIILLTATKPLIFEKGECIELVKNPEGYFKQNELNRVRLSIEREDKSIVDFFHLLNEREWDKDSYMFVFNTIGSTSKFYGLIGENKTVSERTIALGGSDIKTEISRITKNGREYEVHYLSADVVPKTRKERIEIIKKRLDEGCRIIIITTQLIEAGVDIDVDVVFRDFAPLDSIIQVAGRCNRNKRLEREKGEVHIINLVDENNKNKPFAEYIYDPVLLSTVDELLKNRENINDADFLGLINSYFEKTKDNSDRDTKIMKAIYELYYYEKSDKIGTNEKTPISAFKLIKEQPDADVFIELDNDAKRIWQEYKEIREEEDRFERRKGFLKIKKEFYDYVVSIPKRYAAGLINEAQEIAYVSNNEIPLYYDLDTGFKRGDAGSGARIL